MEDKEWSEKVAGLAVDGLVTAKLLPPESFALAVEIVAEEILVRLCLDDRPIDGQSNE